MNARKLEELIVHLASHPGVKDLGPTKLWKLIYFIDAQALRDLGEPVTDSEFIKYQHGPVPSRGEKHLKKLLESGDVTTTRAKVGSMTLNKVHAQREPEMDVFESAEATLIESICKKLGGKSATVLSNLSHLEPSWHYAEMREKLSPELIAYGHKEDPEGL
ncbi:MAG: Panacea domain-containing protein [Chthoniobacterales bacterium]